MLADRQEREQRELRRRAREMRRLELGDAYESSASEHTPNQSDNEETYGEESEDVAGSPIKTQLSDTPFKGKDDSMGGGLIADDGTTAAQVN